MVKYPLLFEVSEKFADVLPAEILAVMKRELERACPDVIEQDE